MPEDLLGLAKVFPLEKLLAIIDKYLGRPFKSYFNKKDADAEAYRIKAVSRAKIDLIKEHQNEVGAISFKGDELNVEGKSTINELPIENDINLRIQNRTKVLEEKRQLNIESIVSKAAEQLNSEPKIDNTPIDEDWIARFFNIISDVSNEEMQHLWGRILAGEIKQPSTFSLRTLETVRNLTKLEAHLFEKYSELSVQTNVGYTLFRNENLKYGEIVHLIEAGLIVSNSTSSYTFSSEDDGFKEYIRGGDYVLVISSGENSKFQIPVYIYTKTGQELFGIINPKPDLDVLKSVKDHIQRINNLVTLKIFKITSYDGKNMKYDDEEIL